MSELPKGWAKVKIEDIAEVKGGKRLPKGHELLNERTNYPYIRVTDFTHGTVGLTKIKYIDEYTHSYIKNYTISKDDLYISIAGTIGLVGQIPNELNNANLTENAAKISGLVGVDKRYLSYVLSSEIGVSQFYDKITSSGQPKLALFRIRECKFPLPPLNEQTRIANKLDSILAKVDKAQARLNKIPTILKRFRQSVLAAATSGELTKEWREVNGVNRSTWSSVRLDEVCHSVSDGDHQAPPKADSGVPFLVISNVSRGAIDFEKVSRWVPNEYFEQLKEIRTPQRGDILYTVTGSYGIPVKVETDKKFCFQRHIAIIKANVEVIDRGFLFVFLSSPLAFEQATKLSTGTAQKTLPLRGLRGFSLESPSLEEQKEIAKNVQCLFGKANKVEKQYLDAKARLDRLTQSILAKAFRGELVPQDPNDEPAEQLLERILKERLSQQQKADKPKKIAKKRTTKAKVTDKG